MTFFLLCHPKLKVLDFVTKENFLNDLLNEPIDSLEAEGINDKVSQKLKHLPPNGAGWPEAHWELPGECRDS